MKRISMLISVVLALFLGGCATTDDRDHPTPWASSAPEFLRLDDGMTLRYVSSGDGPPLVLLHTIRTQLDYFEKLVPELKGYRVYALDLPGHGRSSLQPGSYTEPMMRKAVSEFIRKLDLREVTLVGESIGGVLAISVSVDQPDRVKRVVSLNPYDYGESFGGGIRRSSSGWMVGMFQVATPSSRASSPPRCCAVAFTMLPACRRPCSTSSPGLGAATGTAAWSTPSSRTGPAGWMLASCIPRSRCR
jgi:pimeloyl-ACP methyl ester carboxylesterase